MHNCSHDFFAMLPDLDQVTGLSHTVVICAYCGQVRRLWCDGRIEVVKEYGSISNIAVNTNSDRS